LVWVNHKENENHKLVHGTLLYGENATCVKLKEKQVKEIKLLLEESQLSHNKIASKYNVSRRAITNINTGLSWRHVK
jgi:predicted XRE-type DNA-binding protein